MTNAKRGEVWLVDLNPTRGQEIQKTRPAVVVSSDLFDRIALKIAIPITSWQSKFSDRPFMVRIDANIDNGLDVDSAGNILQIRSLSTERFVKRLGQVSPEILEELLTGLTICTDYELKS
ncbi:type II toxin-antitoxin system PemK/MazF family toxin [Chamaesiphon sp. VAR_69_metabat_338]|uniref:type II toxin-antitoxin system PemK/MazF family toxin n=1 Tax=Chamaesiphon sp. VAR_69_metabat_338 TaxID=2964704 RepID=UPI00286E9E50|nr:type II toxin-antitoxin system PemK/MazF family toxin [Chamaesiphon sp. VAR_69_metabat_338]